LDLDRRIIKWNFRKQGGKLEIEFIWLNRD
jgi:hypothetical protein